ncbi:uncharacterized protein LOC134418953 [Melospiza melodia melodia]|uniref:uncharacterized protein LOC134418953 n=1 Tax=Melospiza melodia melodia TaxID=1914991 RepID=UPI002FD6071A
MGRRLPQRCPLGPAPDGTGRGGLAARCTRSLRSRPAAAATGEAGGGDGEVAPRRRGDAPDGADPPPLPPPCAGDGAPRASGAGEQRGPRRRCPLWQPAVPVRGSGGSAVPARRPWSPLGGRGTPELPAAATGYGAETTHSPAHHSPGPGKPRSRKVGKPERKANPWPGPVPATLMLSSASFIQQPLSNQYVSRGRNIVYQDKVISLEHITKQKINCSCLLGVECLSLGLNPVVPIDLQATGHRKSPGRENDVSLCSENVNAT